MKLIEVGIGEFSASSDIDSVIKTYALGSCVAVIFYDSVNKVGGMIHIALPDSEINMEKAERHPAYFANTGLPLLFKKMNECNINMRLRQIDDAPHRMCHITTNQVIKA